VGNIVLSIKCKSKDKSFPSAYSEAVRESGGTAPHILSLPLDGGSHCNAQATLPMGKVPLVPTEEEARRATELMWKALRRKFLAHSGKWTTIP
jgi:hypothetical protein